MDTHEPECRCTLVDVSSSIGPKRYVLGNSRGCPKHELVQLAGRWMSRDQVRQLLIREARQARVHAEDDGVGPRTIASYGRVACPVCAAPVGRACSSKGGHPRKPHKDRVVDGVRAMLGGPQ